MAMDVLMIGLRNVTGIQGGVEAHVRNLATELDTLGLRVAVCVRTPYAPPGQTLAGTNVRIVRIWATRRVAAEALLHTLFCILYAAWTRPRLVHVHAVGPSLMLPIARLFGLKVVTTHHGEDYQREKWGPVARALLRAGERCQVLFAQGRICVSKTLAARLTQHYGRTFVYIPNGVRKPEALAPTAVLTELGLTPRRYVLAVSRIVPEKRHLDLIEAFSRATDGTAQLVLAGIADRKSASYGRQVETAAAQVPGVVMAGFRSGSELQALYENAALFAQPSSHEGMPIALLEAMAHGCRVIASDLDAHLDLDLGADSYHPLGDIDALAAKIADHLNGHRDAPPQWEARLDTYRWDAIARQTVALYQRVSPRIGR